MTPTEAHLRRLAELRIEGKELALAVVSRTGLELIVTKDVPLHKLAALHHTLGAYLAQQYQAAASNNRPVATLQLTTEPKP